MSTHDTLVIQFFWIILVHLNVEIFIVVFNPLWLSHALGSQNKGWECSGSAVSDGH
jgi:hypothetical protein